MSEHCIKVSAPSNIAIVKYMGKKDSIKNIPCNSSLSLTLKNLRTNLELRKLKSSSQFELKLSDNLRRGLSEKGILKIQKHFERMLWENVPQLYEGFSPSASGVFELVSHNTFPMGAGIASSASSFAAMTVAFFLMQISEENGNVFEEKMRNDVHFVKDLASYSRQGSGSSCRSFFENWVAWENERVYPVIPTKSTPLSLQLQQSEIPIFNTPSKGFPQEIIDWVLVVESGEKEIGSSEAHLRVLSSPFWSSPDAGHRALRAEHRFQEAKQAILNQNWELLCEVAWVEFWDMHQLFHTSKKPFTYFKPATISLLSELIKLKELKIPLLVTMDAGPNIHVLGSQENLLQLEKHLNENSKLTNFQILKDNEMMSPFLNESIKAGVGPIYWSKE